MLPRWFKIKDEAIFERDLLKAALAAIELGEREPFLKMLYDEENFVEIVYFIHHIDRDSYMFRDMASLVLKFRDKDEKINEFYNKLILGTDNFDVWAKDKYPHILELYHYQVNEDQGASELIWSPILYPELCKGVNRFK